MDRTAVCLTVAVLSFFRGGQPQLASGDRDLLDTNGRVILQPDLAINISHLSAISMFVKSINPVRVQLWRRNNVTNFTLDWQQRFSALPVFGRNIVNIDDNDRPAIHPDHRLGIFNERDPGPILYTVTSVATSIFSQNSFDDDPPEVGSSYEFTSLQFPFAFAIMLCNFTGCLSTAPTTQLSTTTTPRLTQTAPTVRVQPAATVTAEEHPLMNGTFLVVLLVWLIVVSFIIITMIIVITYLNVRNKNAIVKADDKGSNADPEGDWYIVVQDTVQAQRVLSA